MGVVSGWLVVIQVDRGQTHTKSNSQTLTDADVSGDAADIYVRNPAINQQFFELGVTQLLVVEERRIGVDIRFVSFLDY